MGYRYRAYMPDRTIVQGTIEATSESAAEDALYQAGYEQILSLKELRRRQTLRSQIPFLFGVKTPDLVDFARQLATLLEVGVVRHADSLGVDGIGLVAGDHGDVVDALQLELVHQPPQHRFAGDVEHDLGPVGGQSLQPLAARGGQDDGVRLGLAGAAIAVAYGRASSDKNQRRIAGRWVCRSFRVAGWVLMALTLVLLVFEQPRAISQLFFLSGLGYLLISGLEREEPATEPAPAE